MPADLLQPEPGWTGGKPETQGQFVQACYADQTGLSLANGKIVAISEIVGE